MLTPGNEALIVIIKIPFTAVGIVYPIKAPSESDETPREKARMPEDTDSARKKGIIKNEKKGTVTTTIQAANVKMLRMAPATRAKRSSLPEGHRATAEVTSPIIGMLLTIAKETEEHFI